MTTALIITNFPILAASMAASVSERYEVRTRNWASLSAECIGDAELVIADLTDVPGNPVDALVPHVRDDASLVLCTLHGNEVLICRSRGGTLHQEDSLPSLLHFTA